MFYVEQCVWVGRKRRFIWIYGVIGNFNIFWSLWGKIGGISVASVHLFISLLLLISLLSLISYYSVSNASLLISLLLLISYYSVSIPSPVSFLMLLITLSTLCCYTIHFHTIFIMLSFILFLVFYGWFLLVSFVCLLMSSFI